MILTVMLYGILMGHQQSHSHLRGALGRVEKGEGSSEKRPGVREGEQWSEEMSEERRTEKRGKGEQKSEEMSEEKANSGVRK